MGRSATQQNAESFLERLQHEAKFLSYEQIESINNALAKATVVLHQAHNERSPLFKLPVEILHKILELVPDSCTKRWKRYHPFWRNTLVDSSMLIPVTHTCHRLREVALAHPHLWATFQTSFKKPSLIRQMATWGKHAPLNAVGSDIGILNDLPPKIRFRSIHLYDIAKHCNNIRAFVEQSSSVALSSFSLLCNETYDWDSKEAALPLSLAHASNIRDLTLDEVRALPDNGFLSLTHLALLNVSAHDFHARVISFIRECPRLQSVALSEFSLQFEGEDVTNDPAPIPLNHLKHVTLIDFSPDALRYYLALLQPGVCGSSVEILGYHARDRSFPRRFLLPPDSQERQTQVTVCIGAHPTGLGDYSVSLTTVFAHTTRRIASWMLQLGTNGIPSFQWPSMVFSDHATSPWTVDEVWLYGVGSSSSPWKRSPLQLFPRARTVVLVAEGGSHHDGRPNLRLLPFMRVADSETESDSEPIGITTLRIVHGFREYDGLCEFACSNGADSGHACRGEAHRERVPLGRLIRDLSSGGYGYLRHFVLQVTPHIYVDGKELEVLRNVGNFETFRFERIKEVPDMPGHSDPAYRGGERYPGALW
ncbi:hypothetical protein LXA43DRAFT_1041286 [Ganoderma leucocontextum]|nr:hypothetical protein LXA43DRAFT_1041286 [Ganoderma leucocontextum]